MEQGASQGSAEARILTLSKLKGVGRTAAAVLVREVFHRDFANRRQVASFLGLAPSPWSSGTTNVEQGISNLLFPNERDETPQCSPAGSPNDVIHLGSSGTLDAEKLEAYLVTHESGARVLVAPTRPDHAASISVDFLRDVYGALRMTNDYVVVDTSPGFTPEVISAIDASSPAPNGGSDDDRD